MRRYIITALMIIFNLLLADNFQELKEIYADLNRDGVAERITWKKFATTELGDYYQIVVTDSYGNIIWKGPKVTDESSPFFIASLDTGVSIPQIVADIDNDGYLEMLIPSPASDISPLWYERLKWKNGKFIPMRSAILQYDPYNTNIPFKWIYRYPGIYSFWAMMFKRVNNKIKASVTGIYPDGSNDYGEVYLHFVNGGAMAQYWIKPLKGPKKDKVNFSYTTRLGLKDHYNSKGVRLTRVIDIIRQDRENFYKGQKDLEDNSDPILIDSIERNDIKEYRVYLHGISRDMIISQTPIVKVTVDSNLGKIDISKVKIDNSKNLEFSYIAKISDRDKYNSIGVQLKTMKDILIQDRANVHKDKADGEDTYDSYFPTARQRADIQNYQIIPIDTSYQNLKREIIFNNPILGVQVGNKVLRIKIIKP